MTKRASGYTILEVMLFLAISAFIFIFAAVAVGGRQKQVQYTQAIRDFEGQMQDILNDVATGYYQPATGFRCNVVGSGAGARPRLQPDGGAPEEQGSSDECMSVGKAVLFNITGAADTSQYGAATIIGIKPDIGATSQVAAESTNPILGYSDNPGNEVDLTDYRNLRFGLEVTGIFDVAIPARSYGAFAIASGFNGASAVKNGLVETTMYASQVALGQTMSDYASAFEGLNNATIAKPTNGIVLCLTYPSDNKKARIYIGEGGSINNVRSDMDVTTGVCS